MNYPEPNLAEHADTIKTLKLAIVSAGLSHLGADEAAHSKLVRAAVEGAKTKFIELGIDVDAQVSLIEVSGVLEIPLAVKQAVKTLRLDGVVACALIVSGGVYRHEFVAHSSLDALMRLSLDTNTPIASTILTPVAEKSPETQFDMLHEHLSGKGKEGASALIHQIIQLRELAA
jgi:6,7-dimethyl-8-ribityllumazine synthase